ncbi:cobaltochelatase subunit CobN, partial [Bosea sp. (in: a-proteobacteria)]|uniref:cobaltochelatase subunit CobN n=1 Tax=Bosea sp. (in: a-proteobacteria) TaxID=1871050 RepID=UPI003B3A9B21
MHLLPTSEIRLDDGEDAVDLGLPPGDMLVLSFADSDLSALAAAARADAPSLRLASLRRLKHPLSVDLMIEKTAAQCRFVLVRCLGGLDYWRYGIEQLAQVCREKGIALAVLPGDDREDERLADYGTVPAGCRQAILTYFRAGGVENMRRMLAVAGRFLAGGGALLPAELKPAPLPALFALTDGEVTTGWREALAALPATRPLVPILLYRSGIVAGDTALSEALAAALATRGLAPLPLALTSLKDPAVTAELAALIAMRKPALIVATTGFSARDGEAFVLDAADCPVLQAVPVGSPYEAWEASPRGLSAADLAMQVALPEFDGRIGAIPVAFKAETLDPATGLVNRRLVPDAEGIAALADLTAGWIALAAKPAVERKLALVMSDYPARGGRAGFAVGLDTPASVTALRGLLAQAGYSVPRPATVVPGDHRETRDPCQSPSAGGCGMAPGSAPLSRLVRDDGADAGEGQRLMAALTSGPASLSLPLATYRAWLATIPAAAREDLLAAHGEPEVDPACRDGAFRFRIVRYGNLIVALQPPRDATPDRKARYHDPDAPPAHGYLAFYLALRQAEAVDALIHLGTHGTTEWLPGKAVALSAACWPRLAVGGLPVIYPYVVDDPGEAAPAKRRLSAVTLGHLPPPLAEA